MSIMEIPYDLQDLVNSSHWNIIPTRIENVTFLLYSNQQYTASVKDYLRIQQCYDAETTSVGFYMPKELRNRMNVIGIQCSAPGYSIKLIFNYMSNEKIEVLQIPYRDFANSHERLQNHNFFFLEEEMGRTFLLSVEYFNLLFG